MSHQVQDSISLEIARRVAQGLKDHPEWIALACANLDRWSQKNSDAPALLRCYDEWRTLLGRTIPDIIHALTAETDEGQRLRQNSPFVGVIPAKEVCDIKARHRAKIAA
jgi:hypothetical protein